MCERREGSQFWKSIRSIKNEIRLGHPISIGIGHGTLFWLHPWVDGSALYMDFSDLFAICADPFLLVSLAAHNGVWNVPFRQSFGPEETTAWAILRTALPPFTPGIFGRHILHLTPSVFFFVRSAYYNLCRLCHLHGLNLCEKCPVL